MITYAQALAIIAGVKLPASLERLPLPLCVGRTLAEDLVARVPSPPFTNSAMDGYAYRHQDIAGQRGPFPVIGTLYARPVQESDRPAYETGSVVRIMTGALLPAWADTVMPVEHTETVGRGDQVRFLETLAAGTNVRRQGEDLAEGVTLLKQGAKLAPERLMVAAAFGYRELTVVARPRLVFFSTGDELTEPGEPLAPGAIYNSSKYFLLSAAQALGFPEAPHRTLSDDETAAAAAVSELLEQRERPTVLVTTGAVSAGELDFVPRLGARLGFQALFHRIAIRPGKPVYLAVKDHVVWLGLPGNAISTCVGWHAFARPLLTTVAGTPPAPRRSLVLKNEVRKPEGLRCFFRAEVNGNQAWVAQRQGSAQLAASINNEAYVELPEGMSRVPAETRVEAFIV